MMKFDILINKIELGIQLLKKYILINYLKCSIFHCF